MHNTQSEAVVFHGHNNLVRCILTNNSKPSSQISENLTISEHEVAEMATVLVGKYGAQAINIAAFFLDEHLELRDHERAESWLKVMTYLDVQHDQTIVESQLN